MDNKVDNKTFKRAVMLLSLAIVIVVASVVIGIIAISFNSSSNINGLAERVKVLESKETEESHDIQYVLYLGTNDKDTNQPVFSKEEAKEAAKEILIDHFGGYTIQEAEGGWKDGDTIYQEYTLVIYLSDTSLDEVHSAADELISKFHQSSVLIQSNQTTTEFYS